jgi:hypothetical protein
MKWSGLKPRVQFTPTLRLLCYMHLKVRGVVSAEIPCRQCARTERPDRCTRVAFIKQTIRTFSARCGDAVAHDRERHGPATMRKDRARTSKTDA